MQLRDLFNEFPMIGAGVVPLALQQLLNEPLNVNDDWPRAERLLLEARSLLPGRLEIPVALYKMYAYSNRFTEAMALIDEVLGRAAEEGGFAADWELLNEVSADWGTASGAVRFYLYSLKAKGFVLLRMGKPEQAHAVLSTLCRLDEKDLVGGSVVLDMAERVLDVDDEAVA